MTGPIPLVAPDDVRVHPGPALLRGIAAGPGLDAHRAQHGALPRLALADLERRATAVGLRGRGGAGFPFATKLAAAATAAAAARGTGGGVGRRRRPVVVVNLAEGEAASSKDMALALTRPHLVLDGAVAAALALGARDLHVVLPGERRRAGAQVQAALAERSAETVAAGLRVHVRTAASRFVAGQARAVVELLEGRPNLPVTAWRPQAMSGLHGRPTLLSNAETWAHVGLLALHGSDAYAEHGTAPEVGTTLLTVTAAGARPEVHEVAFGSRLRDVLPPSAAGSPAVVGGFHGGWATWATLASARVSVPGLAALGVPLGAGVVLLPGARACPVRVTSHIVDHLAGETSGRCGPCVNGLPALADAVRAVLDGTADTARVSELTALVARRGACAHPDGTARLVRSLALTFDEEIAAHRTGGCPAAAPAVGVAS